MSARRGSPWRLEGILREHEGIARRKRKAGRVERCVSEVAIRAQATGEPVERVAARAALAGNLSQASVYRMAGLLEEDGVPVEAVRGAR